MRNYELIKYMLEAIKSGDFEKQPSCPKFEVEPGIKEEAYWCLYKMVTSKYQYLVNLCIQQTDYDSK